MTIYDKERIVDGAINFLQILREDLRKNSEKSIYENQIATCAETLMLIPQDEKTRRRLVDIFEGYKNWKDKEYLDEASIQPVQMRTLDLMYC